MKEKTMTYAGVVLIVLLLITTAIAFISNSKNKRNYSEEKLQNESLSSQKLQVSQELDKVKSDMAALTTKKESDEKELAEADSRLAKTEKMIAHLSKENSSLEKDRNELVQLQKSKSDLDKVCEDLRLKQETALSRIRELENSEILLDAKNKELTASLSDAENYRTDNIEIYGSRGNKQDKLTFVARRTKKLNLNFDVPQRLAEAISFKIITPSGTIITPQDKSLTWLIEPSSANLTASLSSAPGEIDVPRKVALTYSPEEKLIAGEYKIQIFSNEKNIGNCRLKLR
jgi:myosin heavy subunit